MWPDGGQCGLIGGSVANLILRKVHRVHCGSLPHRMFAATLSIWKRVVVHTLNSPQITRSTLGGAELISTWREQLSLAICYITGESSYLFCHATTSLVDMQIAWAMHYEQLDQMMATHDMH